MAFEFHKHPTFEGKHATLSPSNYHWLNYDKEKMGSVYLSHMAAVKGTQIHELAANLIRLGVKLPRNKQTLNMYVNDCIGYGLTPEQVLVYSENCFGTADAIGYKDNVLFIFDLKTGMTKASIDQLKIYAALFCLEYNVDPESLSDISLRIYQDHEIDHGVLDSDGVRFIMDKIVEFDDLIEGLKGGGV